MKKNNPEPEASGEKNDLAPILSFENKFSARISKTQAPPPPSLNIKCTVP